MSEHRVDVVSVKLKPHGNADTLSVVRVAGFACVVRTADWQDGQLAAYVEPDYVVPADRPEFAFLSTSHRQILNNGSVGYRIKVKRLRGVMSMGLLVPAPAGAAAGDNVIDHFGIVRYEPAMKFGTGGEQVAGPEITTYKYDIESAYRYKHLFEHGEEVVATEKIHGANARYVLVDGVMYCGSRTEWKREDASILWWKALANHLEVLEFCKANPGVTVYGEVYGNVQDLKYGCPGQVAFVAFDLLRCGEWVNHDEARLLGSSLPWVPQLYRGPFDADALFALADGQSVLSTVPQVREGIVIKPIIERRNDKIGRTQLKVVSNNYLERA